MLLAIFYVADPLHLRRTPTRFDALLMAALACSLAGDCFLMFPGFFIPGLASFLVAHLFYIALFKRGLPWFPNRRAPFMTLALGAAIYAFLYQGLNPVLKIAVAAYVVVIALMAAQAIGRAAVLRDKASVAVAVGAVFFMLSDSFLAVNKFAFPLPMAQFGVLATYYVAQLLIACNAVPVIAGLTRNPGFLGEARGVAAMDPGSGLPRT
jgi:alkylglycerol monooxygenase